MNQFSGLKKEIQDKTIHTKWPLTLPNVDAASIWGLKIW